MGVLDNLKEPQRLLNKRESQSLHILNTSAHSWWKIANSSDKKAVRDLRQNGSKPGFIADKSKFGGEIEQGDPRPYDQGYSIEAAKAAESIRSISGVNTALVEKSGEAKESGRAKFLRQEAGLTISETIFDNALRTETKMGTFMWEVIRNSDIYSQEEVAAVVQEQDLKQFMTPDGLDLSAMKSMALGRYGVRMLRSPNMPTIRRANFETMLEAIKEGIPIPPEFLIALSEFPNKEEIIQFLRKVAEQDQRKPKTKPTITKLRRA